jgi:hypothetical protein
MRSRQELARGPRTIKTRSIRCADLNIAIFETAVLSIAGVSMNEPQSASVGDPRSELERAIMAEFLHDRGHTLSSARALPTAEAHALLQQASVYASCRLTEVESRAHFVDDMHAPGGPPRQH